VKSRASISLILFGIVAQNAVARIELAPSAVAAK
jgi:hypothetical protein